jgi:hypothetical protein
MWAIPGARSVGEVLVEETPGDGVHLSSGIIEKADVLPVYLEYQVGAGVGCVSLSNRIHSSVFEIVY